MQEIEEAKVEPGEWQSHSPAYQEKKKNRLKRKWRLLVKKEGQLFQRSHIYPSTVITSILKRTHYQFIKAGLKRMYIVLLLFTYCFPCTCGFQTCEKTLPITSQSDIILRNKTSLESLCHLPKVSSCPQMTNCKGNIELCTVNKSSIKISYSSAEYGAYFVETKDGNPSIELGSEGCKGRDAIKTVEIKPEDTNEWITYTLVAVAVVAIVLAVVIVSLKRRWCRSSDKRSSKRPSNTTTSEFGSLIKDNSSTNTGMDLEQQR